MCRNHITCAWQFRYGKEDDLYLCPNALTIYIYIGVRHAYALLHNNDVTQGLYPILMLQVSLGLAVGLHAAAIIVYPTSKLRSLYISL